MLISYHWLKKFVDIKQSPQEIADKITLNLVEVDSITQRGKDSILEIENKGITNRPDCFSQLGIAREVAAYFNLKPKDPLTRRQKTKWTLVNKRLPFAIKVQESNLCYRYSSIVLTNIRVSPSPKWLRVGVENCGIRSINNVVDITNYVMLELGQPLHAFDYQKVTNRQIIVRKAKKGEKVQTFEGDIIKLLPSTLVIADSEKPLAIAGIIGGKEAEINSQTKSIILESANFDKINNRKTEKALKIRTEASTRFEKGLDINLTVPALNRAVELLQEVGGAKVASKLIDIQSKKDKPRQIKIAPAWINRFLGLNLKPQEMVKILQRLQLQNRLEKDNLTITIPTYRSDLNLPADIAEEVARIYGYDKIPITLPHEEDKAPQVNPNICWRKKIKLFLGGLGFSEILTPPFVGNELLEKCEMTSEEHLQLINPLTIDYEFMRRSLIPSLLEIVTKNLKHFAKFKIFEINRIFIPQKNKLPDEIPHLTGAVIGHEFPKVKGIIEALLEEMGLKNFLVEPTIVPQLRRIFHPHRTATIKKGSKLLGAVGEIHPQILTRFGIKDGVVVFDFDFEQLVKYATTDKKYTPIPKYPAIVEDLSFIVPEKTLVGEMIEETKKVSQLIQSIELIDSYQNTRTFRITYQSQKKTLTDRAVRNIRERIIKKIKKNLGAKLKE